MTPPQRLSIVAAFAIAIAPPALGDGPAAKADAIGPALVKAVGLTGTIKDPSRRAKAVATFARAQAIAGDKEGSRRTFALAIDLVENLPFDESNGRTHALARVGIEQLGAGDRPGAIATYRRLFALTEKSSGDDRETYDRYRAVILLQVEAIDRQGVRITLDAARRAFAKQGDQDAAPFSKLWLPCLQAAARDFKGAFAAEGEMPQTGAMIHVKAYLLSAIAESAAACEPADGRVILERVLATAESIKKPMNSPGPCDTVARVAAVLGDFDLAFRSDEAEVRWESRMRFVHGDDYADGQARRLALIAERQSQAGLREDARDTMARADILARSIREARQRQGPLMYVRSVQIRLGLYEEALRPDEGDDAKTRSRYQDEIDRARVTAGDRSLLRKRLEQDLAEAEAELRAVLARSTERNIQRNTAEALVAYYKAELGDLEMALKMVKEIRSVDAQSGALCGIAQIQGRAGDIPGAMEWIGRLDDPSLQAGCVRSLALGLDEWNSATKAIDKPSP